MKRLSIICLIFVTTHMHVQGAVPKQDKDESHLIESLDALSQEAQKSIEDGIAQETKSNPNPKKAIAIFLQELDQTFKPSFVKKYEEIQAQIAQSNFFPPWEKQSIAQKKAEEIYDTLMAKIQKKYLTPKKGCVIQ